jgi:predicted transcriptional regulator
MVLEDEPSGHAFRRLMPVWYCHTITILAATTIRSTYALDEETVRRLEGLAREWNVSKSEALRRAIRAADDSASSEDRLAALDALQASMHLSARRAESWARNVREERRRTSVRRRTAR